MLHLSGYFFKMQDVTAIVNAVHLFQLAHHRFFPDVCRENVNWFSLVHFRHELFPFVAAEIANYVEHVLKGSNLA